MIKSCTGEIVKSCVFQHKGYVVLPYENNKNLKDINGDVVVKWFNGINPTERCIRIDDRVQRGLYSISYTRPSQVKSEQAIKNVKIKTQMNVQAIACNEGNFVGAQADMGTGARITDLRGRTLQRKTFGKLNVTYYTPEITRDGRKAEICLEDRDSIPWISYNSFTRLFSVKIELKMM